MMKREQQLYGWMHRNTLREELVTAYGGKCVRCGEDDPIVLMLDHIFNDGAAERRISGNGGLGLWRKLKRQGWPKDRYQLLCCNCNFRKQYLLSRDRTLGSGNPTRPWYNKSMSDVDMENFVCKMEI